MFWKALFCFDDGNLAVMKDNYVTNVWICRTIMIIIVTPKRTMSCGRSTIRTCAEAKHGKSGHGHNMWEHNVITSVTKPRNLNLHQRIQIANNTHDNEATTVPIVFLADDWFPFNLKHTELLCSPYAAYCHNNEGTSMLKSDS